MGKSSILDRRFALLGKKAPLFYKEPVHIVRGDGVWLYDSEDKKYLDAYNNVPCVGHSHPHVVDALTKQASTLNVHTRYLSEVILDYGERLVGTMDESLSRPFFVCTGTEANELAIRIAREATGGMGIIGTNNTYHGNSNTVMQLAYGRLHPAERPDSPHFRYVPYPQMYRPPAPMSETALAQAYAAEIQAAIDDFKKHNVKFAGILICPIFANEGLPDVPAGYFDMLEQIVHDAGGVIIFDEVQSGFGRTGSMWAYEATGIVPDILTMGKPMGNGHPLAATVTTAELADKFQENQRYFNTFGGNPVSCAVGNAVLDVLEDEALLDRVMNVSAYLLEGLEMMQNDFDTIGDIRNSGMFFAIELVKDRVSKQPSLESEYRIVNMIKSKGVLLSSIGPEKNILKIRPPLPFDIEHADLLLEKLTECFVEANY
ncbi:MAG: aspartate aminotransferase family protein [Chloroflexota bacterium]